MSTEKRLEKVRKLTKNYGEPTIDPFDYKASLIGYLNYHNTNSSDSDRRKWAEQYLEKFFPGQVVPNREDREFRMLGSISRLFLMDSYIEDNEVEFLDTESRRLLAPRTKELVPDTEVNKVSRSETIEKTIEIKVSEFIGEFEGLVDEFTTTGTTPSIQGLITSMGVSSRTVPKIAEYAKKKRDYYLMVVNDKEAFEYYSFSKPTLKKIAAMYDTLLEKLSQNKKIRKTRERKERPAGVLVQALKFKAKDDELGLKSVQATGIIGASEIYLFRIDSRKLQYFKAVDGQTLTVKGTTIMNFDESKSYQKTIRKPEILKDFHNKGKVESRRFMKEIKSTEGGTTGRTNDETIILSTFK